MKIDSCKNCGKKLIVKKDCLICNEAILFQCVKCNYSTEKKSHLQCQIPVIEVQSGRRLE